MNQSFNDYLSTHMVNKCKTKIEKSKKIAELYVKCNFLTFKLSVLKNEMRCTLRCIEELRIQYESELSDTI